MTTNHTSAWPAYFRQLWRDDELDVTLDTSRMQLGDDLYERMQPAFADALDAMRALEQGAVANPDEGRRVGHYWLRAPALAPERGTADAIRSSLASVQRFADKVLDGTVRPPDGGARFTDALCIGIGGSALGPQLLADALANDGPGEGGGVPLRLHFLDNTDPAGIDRVMRQLAPVFPSLLVLVTSKSGGTPETRNGMLEAAAAMESAGVPFAPRAVAITGEGSHLATHARENGWLDTFFMPDWVGGRTSLFSAVGLLPAALAGIDLAGLLAGARRMDEATRAATIGDNPAARLALAWFDAGGGGRGQRDMVVLPYKDALILFSRYLQQLVMESLGKELDLDGNRVHQGLAVYGNKGSTDQHAYVQQLREGLDNFFVVFIEVLEGRASSAMPMGGIAVADDVTSADYLSGFLYGTRDALTENGRRSLTITIPRVDARRLGALVALFERAVGFYANLININAYHQPGVEAGKRAAGARLELQRALLRVLRSARGTDLALETLAASAGANDLESVFQVARHLAANRADVSLSGDPRDPASLRMRLDA
jgi:glucose-6-phosphate isomerase